MSTLRARRIETNGLSRYAADPRVAVALLAAAATVWLLHEGNRFTFQADEWDWLLHRRGHSLGVFLRPHNEHLSALPILVYKLFFQLFGATSTFPFRLVDALLAAASAVLLFELLAPRIGRWTAVAPVAVLLFFGPAWSDLLWGFQLGYLASLAAGLGALLALDRSSRRSNLAATALLVISLACSSVGLPILVGVIVELLLTRRRGGSRRLWVAVIPLLLYGLWYQHYGVSSVHLSYFHLVPLYAFQGLAAVLGSLTGLTAPSGGNQYAVTIDPGTTLAVLLLAALGVTLARRATASARFWAAAATPFAFWAAAALSYIPGREADQGRYTYPVAPFVLLAVAELFIGWRGTRRTQALIAFAAIAAITSNLGFLRQGAHLFDLTTEYARPELGAMQIARPVVLPGFRPESAAMSAVIGVHNMTPIDAKSYFAAIDSFGSPGDTLPRVLHAPEAAREAADYVLAKAERLALLSARGSGQQCKGIHGTDASSELAISPSGSLLLKVQPKANTGVEVRRLAATYRFVTLKPTGRDGSWTRLALPSDSAMLPWYVRIVGSPSVLACAVRSAGSTRG